MKTVFEETANASGLPSFQTERPNSTETKPEPALPGRHWAAERLQHMVQTSAWENAWRAFGEYDSPLAG
jgi:hypothetical protein